tara:strand:- start:736 stop:915 length:180 start_codon:yes stop_codon:yes gene_type:complete
MDKEDKITFWYSAIAGFLTAIAWLLKGEITRAQEQADRKIEDCRIELELTDDDSQETPN